MIDNREIKIKKPAPPTPTEPPKLDVTVKRQVISVVKLIRRHFPEEWEQIVEISLAK